ncbi:hypothetical protein TNCV_3350021 [Trichonephila clavipes]|nr:hypothetical protein TNCV_3350021 [Trichonephila clavipes]
MSGLDCYAGRGSLVVKVRNCSQRLMSSSLVLLKTHRVGEICRESVKSVENSNVLPLVWELVEEMPAQVSSSSLDHGSK